MNGVIVCDSSYLFSLAVAIDSNYKKALQISKQLETFDTIVLPAEVFSETMNALWKKISKSQAILTAKDILETNYYFFAETTSEVRSTALAKFEKQSNSVSFTDCLVMAFADHFKTKTILGFDESFSKSGYLLP